MAVGLVIFLLYMGFVTLLNRPNQGSGNVLEAGVDRVASVLQWTPPGALAALPHLVAAGDWAAAALAAVDRPGRAGAGLVVVVGGAADAA